MILAARKIDIEQDDRGHDSDHSDGMISCENLAEHRDAYDGRHDRLRKGKHSSLTGFHMGKAGGVPGIDQAFFSHRVETSPSSRE